MLFGLFKSLDEKVKEDTDNLIQRLKTSDIKTLVKEMDNDGPISLNILKKQKRDSAWCSQDSPSWFAYRISDELSDSKLKLELFSLIEDKEYESYQRYIYRCLSSLCVNTGDFELFDYLLKIVREKDNEDLTTTVLSRLKDLKKPETLNIEILKELLIEGTYQNRIDALQALCNSEHTELEEILCNEFKMVDNHTKGMICVTLRTVGSRKCFELLDKEYKTTRSQELKWDIDTAKEDILKRIS